MAEIVVNVAIPHFYREGSGGQAQHGSGRPGARWERGIALARCLSALRDLRRSKQDLVLNIGDRCINPIDQRGIEWRLNIWICTDGTHVLDEVLELFRHDIKRHEIVLEQPRTLALATRDFLLMQTGAADLYLYLEDDIVIHDRDFLSKQQWFLSATNGQVVLMPHRYEMVPQQQGQRLCVDGPLRQAFISQWAKPQAGFAHGKFRGEELVFDRTANPHAGLFCVNQQQKEQLLQRPLPTEGFVGPLETAATLTVLQQFPVLKPSWNNRQFLWVEHGHPSFQAYSQQWERRALGT